jgi:NAD/NADP transhydrogenase alpha subunit
MRIGSGWSPPRSPSSSTHGHQVFVEAGAGIGSGLSDAEYTAAGATLREGPEAIFTLADIEGAAAGRAEAPQTGSQPDPPLTQICARPHRLMALLAGLKSRP